MAKSVYIEICADPIQPRDIILLRRARELDEVSVGFLSDAALANAKRVPGMRVSRVAVQTTLDCLPNLREHQPDIVEQGWLALVHNEAFRKSEGRATS